MGAAAKLLIRKGAQSDDFGTPAIILDVVRDTFREEITLDLASSDEHNKIVRADKFFSKEDPCPAGVVPQNGSLVWCNPPGPVANVRWFWDEWRGAVGSLSHGGFLIFQIDHWRSLNAPHRPLWCVLWPSRVQYLGSNWGANFSSVLVLTSPPLVRANVVRWG